MLNLFYYAKNQQKHQINKISEALDQILNNAISRTPFRISFVGGGTDIGLFISTKWVQFCQLQ